MARKIVTFFSRIAKRSVRGKVCPNCGSTNASSPEGDLNHCFGCGNTWR